MDFNLTEEQQMLRESAARFVREQYGFDARRRWAEAGGWSPECWSRYAEFGWLALGIPEEFGGLGCSFVEIALVAEELGRGMALEPFTACAVLAARLIERGDAPAFDAQRASLLGDIAGGQAVVLLAHAEADSRFELDAVTARARRDGAAWRLDGAKLMVAGAPAATHFVVSACIEGEGMALFLVPRAAVSLRTYPLIDGTQGADIDLDSVAVGPNAVANNAGARPRLYSQRIDLLQ